MDGGLFGLMQGVLCSGTCQLQPHVWLSLSEKQTHASQRNSLQFNPVQEQAKIRAAECDPIGTKLLPTCTVRGCQAESSTPKGKGVKKNVINPEPLH